MNYDETEKLTLNRSFPRMHLLEWSHTGKDFENFDFTAFEKNSVCVCFGSFLCVVGLVFLMLKASPTDFLKLSTPREYRKEETPEKYLR